MKKIPVKGPRDIPEIKLPPLIVERVEVKKPPPPEVKIGWGELFFTWLPMMIRGGMQSDIQDALGGERPLFWSSLIGLLRQDWWKLAILLIVPVIIWAATKIFA